VDETGAWEPTSVCVAHAGFEWKFGRDIGGVHAGVPSNWEWRAETLGAAR
jgi:hypothetical protein